MKIKNKTVTRIARTIAIWVEQNIFCVLSDEKYIRLQYRFVTGKRLDLDNPQTYNEKLQWLKLNDHREEYKSFVDKLAAKEYVAQKIGKEYIIPTLAVWNSVNEIEWDSLPSQFVIKCTHDSGGVVICNDPASFNRKRAFRLLSTEMKRDYYLHGREWGYKGLDRKILMEPYITDESNKELKDYKVFCFNGEPKVIQVDFDRFNNHRRNLYTPEWEYIDAMIKYPKDPSHQIEKPVVLKEMLQCAAKLSEGIPQSRIDFYVNGNQLLFGEITLCHGSGCEQFTPESFGKTMGDWIDVR